MCGVCVALVQQCESGAARIVGHRCAREENVGGCVECENARDREERKPSQMLPLRLFKLFFYTGKRSQLGDVIDSVETYSPGAMRRGNVQYWHNVHNEAPFFVPEEAHEEDEEKSGLDECPDASVLYKTNRDEQLGRHKMREERPTSGK